MENIETEKDYEGFAKVKKINNFCKIMIDGTKTKICADLYNDVMVGNLKPDEYIDRMKGKFKTNKRFTKLIDISSK